MYGLVNKAIHDLVVQQHGEDVWERIAAAASVDAEGFISMDAYDDGVTYRLVGAASEELGVPAASLLEAFGEFWITYTADEGYAALLEASGRSFGEFLDNLDELHTRVAMIMPQLVPPEFVHDPIDSSSSTIRYRSERDGLAPMVVGLLRGLGRRFGHEVAVEVDASDPRDVEFRVSWAPERATKV